MSPSPSHYTNTGASSKHRSNGGVSATGRDSLTITAPGASGSGTLTASYMVHGSATASVDGYGDSFANYFYQLSLVVGAATAVYTGTANADINTPSPPGSAIPSMITLVTPFFFGEPIDLSASFAFDFWADARRVPIYDQYTLVGFDDSVSNITGAFNDTIYWDGITSVTDSAGRPVDYTVSSLTGFDYSGPALGAAPEISTWAMLSLGFCGLAAASRRRSGAESAA